MKILKIELQNINSLKCDKPIVIDFESEKFQDIGLFAITGATGAGKTTILDAITIALYNKVPRFNSTHVKAGLEDVVSYGADVAMARVEFASKGVRYEAQWSIRMISKTGKRLGNPKDEVRLKNLSEGKILAQKKRDVQSMVEEITQLSYDQFLRSVMLAQGEFAAFLSAKPHDKGTLLEQITGEQIYKKIGEALLEKLGQEKKKLEMIQSKINTEDLLSGEEIIGLNEEQKELAAKTKAFEKELKGIEKVLNWFKEEKKLEELKQNIDLKQINLGNEVEENQESLELLEKHELAVPFKESVTETKRIGKEIINLKNLSESLTEKITGLSSNLEKATGIEKQKKDDLTEIEKANNSWQSKLEKVAKLETETGEIKKTVSLVEHDINDLTEKVNHFQGQAKTKGRELIQSEEELKDIQSYLATHTDIPQIDKHLPDWSADLNQRKNYSSRIAMEVAAIQKGMQEKTSLSKGLDKSRELLESEKKSHDKLQSSLGDISKQLENYDLVKLLAKQKSLNYQKDKLSQLITISTRYKEYLKKEKFFEQEKENLTTTKNELASSLLDTASSLKSAQQSLIDANKIYELQRTVKDLSDERKKLKKGEPCIVCGSTEHPKVKEYETYEPSDAFIEVEKRKAILEGLQEELQALKDKTTEVKAKLDLNINSLFDLEKLIRSDKLRFNVFLSDFNIEKAEEIQKAFDAVTKKNMELDQKIKTTQDLQKKKDDAADELKFAVQKVNSLNNTITKLHSQIFGLDKGIEEKEEDLKKLRNELLRIESLLETRLSAFKIEMPKVIDTVAFIDDLKVKVEEYDLKSIASSEKQNEISKFKTDIKHFKKQIDEKLKEKVKKVEENQKRQRNLTQLISDRHEILPADVSTEAKRLSLQKILTTAKNELEIAQEVLNKLKTDKNTAEKEKQNADRELSSHQNNLKEMNQELKGKLADSLFDKPHDVEAALLSLDDHRFYTQIRRELNDKEVELKTLQKKLKTDLQKLEEAKDFELTIDEAGYQKEKLDDSIKELLKRTGEINNKFEKDDAIKARNKGVVAEIEAQQKVLNKWNTLKNLLGGSKDAFNTYVQRLTLQNLIQLANVHLFKLNKRYSLKMNETYTSVSDALNFNLIDHYQTDQARYVDTSSGGEKFLISLALALGLSDLASHNINVESLFIDEGFGTLDTNTLETVISTLETLQAQGKMIGVISHVENLKERIPTQIQINKIRNGVSEVLIS